tara:strand:+ start:1386 stop:1691 length:306 start_codon:yes stop_codon:yes gene_type:complete
MVGASVAEQICRKALGFCGAVKVVQVMLIGICVLLWIKARLIVRMKDHSCDTYVAVVNGETTSVFDVNSKVVRIAVHWSGQIVESLVDALWGFGPFFLLWG